MAYTWEKANANAPSTRKTQYFEMLGNRAIYQDGGRFHHFGDAAVGAEHQGATGRDHRLQLGALQRRRRSHPIRGSRFEDAGQTQQLQDVFYAEAKKYNVLPLDNTTLARWNTPRPSLTAGRTEFTYSGELIGTPASAAPSILNKGYTITAEVEIPKAAQKAWWSLTAGVSAAMASS